MPGGVEESCGVEWRGTQAGHRDEMKACTETFHSLPGAFRGSKDASESEEGLKRWRRRGGAGRGAKWRGRRMGGGRLERRWRRGRGHSVWWRSSEMRNKMR